MRKSIYDILGKRFNIVNEYEKLYELFTDEKVYKYGIYTYSLANLFNKFIEEWKFRATYRNTEEILNDLNLMEDTDEEHAMNDILYLIELILNIDLFIENKTKDLDKKYFDYDDKNVTLIYKKSNITMENIEILLKELGYKYVKKPKDKILLRKNNVIAIETAQIVENNSIADLILDYTDFRIENDLKAKKDILNSLGQYLEPLRKDIKKIDSNLEDYIFFCLNKLNIRHNNKSGKKKIEFVSKLKKKEIIAWYDKIYDLIIIAIRLLELPNSFKEFKELKTKIINEKETV